MASRFRNLVGQKFNKLTVLEYAGRRQFASGSESQWRCQCDCGKTLVVPQRYLVTDGTKSCGCIIGKHKRTHGYTGTPTFRTWESMRRRCADEKNRNYARYGGRGIKVCERWQKFENFLADMGERPAGMTLDRYPNNDGNYEPGNCRWASAIQQSNNRRSSRRLTVNGETRTLAEWEKLAGLKPGAVWHRLKAGASPEEAIASRVPKGHRDHRAADVAGWSRPCS